MWADDAKIAFLDGTLNDEMKRAMLGHQVPGSYGEYVQKLVAVDGQLQALRGRHTSVGRTNETMDWEPTQAMTVGAGRTTQRMTPKEREDCLREGRCFRCREIGHMAHQCPKGSEEKAQSRTAKRVRVAGTKVEKEETESDSEESEVSALN